MFSLGARVVHPFYGAGEIVRIQEKAIGDARNDYYVIRTVARSMDLMVPVSRADELGLRAVGEAAALRGFLQRCEVCPDDDEINPDLRARQTEMRVQLKSGAFPQVADVTRCLYFLNTRRSLGIVDRRLFEQGKEFLAGELALADGLDLQAAVQEVEGLLSHMMDPP